MIVGVFGLVFVAVSAVQIAFVWVLDNPLKAKKMAVPRLKLVSLLSLLLFLTE